MGQHVSRRPTEDAAGVPNDVAVGRRERRPSWVAALAERVRTAQPDDAGPTSPSLRPAEVLVLLVDSAEGPQLLLTERAATLSHYPGYLAFPGGAVEAADDGFGATALREAREEIGLDAARVHLVGQLPTIPVAASSFAVTPVVAWSAALDLVGFGNPDEVAAVVQVPLGTLDRAAHRVARQANDSRDAGWHLDGRPVGPMTASVIDFFAGLA